MRTVVIESPLSAPTEEEREDNRKFARACCRDAILNYGEAPFASHLLYDQPGLLHDDIPEERTLGIKAGLEFVRFADATVVYEDRGISEGMRRGINAASAVCRPIEYRTLGEVATLGRNPKGS